LNGNKDTGNKHAGVVEGFGREWSSFDQSGLSDRELEDLFEMYFRIFPWDALPEKAIGFDLGCGSGRWDRFVAPRVGGLHCIDASAAALEVAKRNLQVFSNCFFHLASVDAIPLNDDSMDFGFCLGVLHHVPDTKAGVRSCVDKLRPGAPFLIYLYYSLENRPAWYRLLWKASDRARRFVATRPHRLKMQLSQAIAMTIYYPLARLSSLVEKAGVDVSHFPLSYYRRRSVYTMKTDALDRFGTTVEKRFSRDEITQMLEEAGLTEVTFSDAPPYWCAVGRKAPRASTPTRGILPS